MAAAILHPAPAWKPDRSDYVVLWHGCTAIDKNNIEAKGIELTAGRSRIDFGQGFYTTTWERQARQWAWWRFYELRKGSSTTANQPVILRFRVRRYSLGRVSTPLDCGLDDLRSLSFVSGDFHCEDYWSFVQHCRSGVKSHNHIPNGWYDLVTGPVAAMWKQRVGMDDSDQISFHTPKAIELLDALIDQGKGKGLLRQGDPHFYRWEIVT